MNKALLALTATALLASSLGAGSAAVAAGTKESRPAKLTLKSTEKTDTLKGAVYLKSTGLEMIKKVDLEWHGGSHSPDDGSYSPDNGRTWTPWLLNPNFDSKLPHGYRRGQYPPFVDPVNGNIITAVLSLDTFADPSTHEPRIGEKAYI